MTSNNATTGFVNYHIGTESNTTIQDLSLITEITVEIGVNDYWIFRSQLSTAYFKP